MASANPGRQGSAGKGSPVPHTRVEDETKIEELYEMGEKLGQGSFGVVHLATHKKSSKTWACKIVNKEKAGSSAIKLLEREVSILKRVHHEHIIQLKEVFETSKRMYLIMEYCENGELADVLKERHTFSEEQTRTIMSRMASAIAYLHKNDMVHRDLKLENILLGKNPSKSSDDLYIKVTDFGLSVVKGGVGHENMMADFCGTPMYMAPEIIDNKTYSEKCDIWAMGVIMYILLSGLPPFRSNDEEKLYEIIKVADMEKIIANDPAFAQISKEACDCVCGMLKVNPAHRLTAGELMDDSWITGKSLGETLRRQNVLEMMREFGRGQNSSDEENTVNGGQPERKKNSSECSTNDSSSQESSNSSTKRGKLNSGGGSAGSRRTNSAGDTKLAASKKPLPRVATEPQIMSTTIASSAPGSHGNRLRTRASSAGNIKAVSYKKPLSGVAKEPTPDIGSAKSRLRTNSAGNIKSVVSKKSHPRHESQPEFEYPAVLSSATGVDGERLRRHSMGNIKNLSSRKHYKCIDSDLEEDAESTENYTSPSKCSGRVSHHSSTGNLASRNISGTKSKSPVDREGTIRTTGPGKLNSQPHHAARPAATRTSNGATRTAPESRTKKKSR